LSFWVALPFARQQAKLKTPSCFVVAVPLCLLDWLIRGLGDSLFP